MVRLAPKCALVALVLAKFGARDRLGTLSIGFLAKPGADCTNFGSHPSPERRFRSEFPNDVRSGLWEARERPPFSGCPAELTPQSFPSSSFRKEASGCWANRLAQTEPQRWIAKLLTWRDAWWIRIVLCLHAGTSGTATRLGRLTQADREVAANIPWLPTCHAIFPADVA